MIRIAISSLKYKNLSH
jgi:hypothetical protein